MKLLMDYDWPGNVRELENVVERAVVLSTQELMEPILLPESVRTKEIVGGVRLQTVGIHAAAARRNQRATGGGQSEAIAVSNRGGSRAARDCDMLERTGWNQTEAAERFQIPLSTLNQKIKRLGIEIRRRGAGRGADEAEAAAGK